MCLLFSSSSLSSLSLLSRYVCLLACLSPWFLVCPDPLTDSHFLLPVTLFFPPSLPNCSLCPYLPHCLPPSIDTVGHPSRPPPHPLIDSSAYRQRACATTLSLRTRVHSAVAEVHKHPALTYYIVYDIQYIVYSFSIYHIVYRIYYTYSIYYIS